MNHEISWLDYFSGGVPTGEYFRMTLDDLRKSSALGVDDSPGISRLQEICFIGLFSYFEAFCKDHFASLINIEPGLILNLKTNGQDVSIDSSHVILYGDEVDRRIGFVLAEKYDFGSAQKINALFRALLKVTPFGRDDSTRYASLLRDRNLLVHHGGVFTLTYLEQTVVSNVKIKSDAFFNSKTLNRPELMNAVAFIEGIAKKLLRSSQRALIQHIEDGGGGYSGERKKAVEGITWWDD